MNRLFRLVGLLLRQPRSPALALLGCGIVPLLWAGLPAAAQMPDDITQQEEELIRRFSLPSDTGTTPRFNPPSGIPPSDDLPAGQSEYILEFSRSPVVGNALRLQGIVDVNQLAFPSPRNWSVESARATIRFQHSDLLDPGRSNITVRFNGSSIGSLPLDRPEAGIATAVFDIPPERFERFNILSVLAQQYDSQACTDPANPGLWTEILPDSYISVRYTPVPVDLDFSRYPYPFFDTQALGRSRLAYLVPQQVTPEWLTAVSRFQVDMGRLADFRPLQTRLVPDLAEASSSEPVAIVGTPSDHPVLASLDLPFDLVNNQWTDGNNRPLPTDVGVLMLTTVRSGQVPLLVISGNGSAGVLNGVRTLISPTNREIGTGQALLATTIADLPSPPARDWPRYLPDRDRFPLSDLSFADGSPIRDTTVRGTDSGEIEFDFRALPDDRFTRGNHIKLHYSYGPQTNPRTSAIEVLLDDIVVGGHRLTNLDGETGVRAEVALPEGLIAPNTRMTIAFRLNPRQSAACGLVSRGHLWGTLHADSTVNLRRQQSVELPDLALLRYGYPFAAPQDLSSSAAVLPDRPSFQEMQTLMQLALRLGRLSRARDVKWEVYTASTLPARVRDERHLIAIGDRQRFPFPELLTSGNFRLYNVMTRRWQGNTIQTLTDSEGAIQTSLSPWNSQRLLLSLSGQTPTALERIQDFLAFDAWFFQLEGDTAFIKTFSPTPDPFNPNTFELEFLSGAPTRRFENLSLLAKISRQLQENWLLLIAGFVVLALALYIIIQTILSRMKGNPS